VGGVSASENAQQEVLEYRELIRQQMRQEEAAERRVRRTFRRLLLGVADTVWGWGDGEGGWMAQELARVAESLGLPVPRHELALPPSGPHHRAIYERDAYRCQLCGDWHDLTIDHIVPRSKGGTDDPGNLRVLCRSCNSRKGAAL